MLLATSRICARPVTFCNNFDKYNGREGPEGNIAFSNVLQSPTGSVGNSSHFSNVRLIPSVNGQQNYGPWSTWNFKAIGGFRANLGWFSFSGSALRLG